MIDFAQARRNMVDSQLRTFDVTDRAVLAAMDEIPRERFMPAGLEPFAYSDVALDARRLGAARPPLAPMVVARMIQALAIADGERALDVAGGAGYSAAVLARLGARVVALEGENADPGAVDARLADLGLGDRVEARAGDVRRGCPDLAPFDAVLVNGAVEEEPSELLEQLGENGRLACLKLGSGGTRALLYVKANGAVSYRALFDAAAPSLPEYRRPPAFTF